MKQSPLYQKLNDLNAQFEIIHDWALPMSFGSIEKEYAALRQEAGIIDFSHRGKIKVTGSDRASFLHNMLSNDIKTLKVSQARYALLLTPKGKIISDLFVYGLSDHHWLECAAENTSKIMERLNSFIITEDVQLEDVTNQYALISIQGPSAVQAAPKLNITDDIHVFQNTRLRTSGLDIWVPYSHAISFWEKVSGFENFQPAGFSAYEIVRIEDGIPEYGKELDENTIPNEAGLENAISFTKGCYPGQEIVARIKYLGGVQKKLCGLILEERETPLTGSPIFMDESKVGTLTSACYSLSMKSAIGLGYLKTSIQNPKVILNIHWKDVHLKAKLRSFDP